MVIYTAAISGFESASVKEIEWREEKKELFEEGGRRRKIMGKEGKRDCVEGEGKENES